MAERIVRVPAPYDPPSRAETYYRAVDEWEAGEFDTAIESFRQFLLEADASTSRGQQYRIAAMFAIAGLFD